MYFGALKQIVDSIDTSFIVKEYDLSFFCNIFENNSIVLNVILQRKRLALVFSTLFYLSLRIET